MNLNNKLWVIIVIAATISAMETVDEWAFYGLNDEEIIQKVEEGANPNTYYFNPLLLIAMSTANEETLDAKSSAQIRELLDKGASPYQKVQQGGTVLSVLKAGDFQHKPGTLAKVIQLIEKYSAKA